MTHKTQDTILALLLVFLLWGLFSTQIPPFDLDETLYLRVAEEMKQSLTLFNPTFDGWPFLHKPPFFYAWIAGLSRWIEPSSEIISLWIARSVGLVASLSFLFLLGSRGFLYLGTSVVALVSLFALIFDPIQSVFILGAFLAYEKILASLDLNKNIFKFILFTTLATLWKGLNAPLILLSTLGISGIWDAFQARAITKNFKTLFLTGVLTLGSVVSAYFILWKLCGDAFMREFFWVQHFERSSQPLESHGGFLGYYIIELLLFASPLLYFSKPTQWSPSIKAFTFSVLIIFSFSATKLPHYIWPLFPVLALSAVRNENRSTQRNFSTLVLATPILLGLILFTISIIPDWKTLNQTFSLSLAAQVYLEALSPFGKWDRIMLFAVGVIGLLSPAWLPRIQVPYRLHSIVIYFLFVLFGLTVSLVPKVQEVMQTPFAEVSEFLKKQSWDKEPCYRWHGPQSPTFSRALGLSIKHNRCDNFLNQVEVRITPKWKGSPCEDPLFKTIYENKILKVCVPASTKL